MVAVALAGAVTDAGLIVHTGGSIVACDEVTWQLKLTVPENPLTDPTWMVDAEVPPGATASGENEDACSVNSEVPCCAKAAGTKPSTPKAAIRHKQARPAWPNINFNLDSDLSDLNMSWIGFK